MSSHGHKYLMVAVEMDGNYIDAKPMKTRDAKECIRAYLMIWSRWKASKVIALNLCKMGNKAPKELKQIIHESG